jgi:hypothetical protein
MAQRSYEETREASPWAMGLVLFAGTMMIMIGIFQIFNGLAAIIEDDFYVLGIAYAYEVDVTVWGWIHLILGVVVAIAGWAVMSGQPWARVVGITLATLSSIANFLFIPYYPVWSLLIIAIDVFVIWALSVYGRREAERAGMVR